jgi:hypothetical protein
MDLVRWVIGVPLLTFGLIGAVGDAPNIAR